MNKTVGQNNRILTPALSVKQPWAALLLGGVKTIEIRRWSTNHRGRILLHAARMDDPRQEGWDLVSPQLLPWTELRGGIIGSLDLQEQRSYLTPHQFQSDHLQHHNNQAWFNPPMFGFVFTNPNPLPFRRCPGQVRFFGVEEGTTGSQESRSQAQLLVSVRSAREAETAVAAGTDLVDVKEPARGSLGRADDSVIASVVRQVNGRRPVSAALGELRQALIQPLPSSVADLTFVKWGLAGYGNTHLAWKMELLAAVSQLRRVNPICRWVAVAYADWERARSPRPMEVAEFAAEVGAGAFLIDTHQKDGKSLLDFLNPLELSALIARCQENQIAVALAGSLTRSDLLQLQPLPVTWFAVRGAACRKGDRTATIDGKNIRSLLAMIRSR